MIDLILWRHAEAEDGANDLARALTRHGEQQAEQMATWLKPRLPEGYQVFASEARRAQQTAAALAGRCRILPELNPSESAEHVLAAIGWPRLEAPTVVVGHQPWLGQIAAQLLAGEPQFWSVKKGAIWWLGLRQRHGGDKTLLKLMMAPAMLGGRHAGHEAG